MRRRPVSARTFARWCRELRQLCPLDRPAAVRRLRFPRDRDTRRAAITGECIDHGDRWLILIEETLDRAATAETLVHEWAHAYRDELAPEGDGDHDDLFWTTYGSIYRSFYGVQ